MNKVSIIVPIYNSSKYLERCLNSILNQTYKEIEVILINDGSIDSSEQICQNYCKKDNRVKYFYQKNSGASMARNNGIDKANGEYIMFVDSDDSIDEKMVGTLIHEMECNKVDFVISGMKVIYSNGNEISYSNETIPKVTSQNIPSIIVNLCINERINGPVAKLYKRDILIKNNVKMPLNIHLNEDLYFNINYVRNIKSLSIDSNAYYNYYNNENSVTGRYYSNRYDMMNFVHNNLISYFENTNVTKSELNMIYYIYVKNVYSAFLNLFHNDCTLNKKRKIKEIDKIINSGEFSQKIALAYRPGLKYKILLGILKLKNKSLIYYFVKIIYFIRKRNIMRY